MTLTELLAPIRERIETETAANAKGQTSIDYSMWSRADLRRLIELVALADELIGIDEVNDPRGQWEAEIAKVLGGL